ncbi:MAG: ABC transporter permease [Litorimonas sp.]
MTSANQSDSDKKEALPVYSFDASTDGFAYALDDLKTALSRPRLLLNLVQTSFFSKYQGTFLGGFWITATTFMMVSGLALLYSRILGDNLSEYFPYVAIGIIVWGLISTLINEGASVFLAASVAFNQAPIPKTTFALRLVGTALLGMLYKLIIVIGVLVYFKIFPSWQALLLSVAGMVLILWTGFWFALFVGTIGTKFRDVGQLTGAFLTFAFFVTPVFWRSDRLGDLSFVITYNPLYHYINTIRGSLLGYSDVAESFMWAAAVSVLMAILGFATFSIFAKRIVYWS